ncbi:MAG TPA: hypothetical protein VFN10_06500 [Thermoanaerobaculia bacterium]|nr:hypothetical protein [Thermoanaerobaculia bacterium]
MAGRFRYFGDYPRRHLRQRVATIVMRAGFVGFLAALAALGLAMQIAELQRTEPVFARCRISAAVPAARRAC